MRKVLHGMLFAFLLVFVAAGAFAAFVGHDLYTATPVSDWLTFNISGTNGLTQVGAQQDPDNDSLSFSFTRDGYTYFPDGFVAAPKMFDVMLVRYKGDMTDGSVPADIAFSFVNKTDTASNDIAVTASFDALERHAGISNVAIDDSDTVTTSFSGFSENAAFAQYGLVSGNGAVTFNTTVISPDGDEDVDVSRKLLYSHLADTANPYVLVRGWLIEPSVNIASLNFATLGAPTFSRLFNGGTTRVYAQNLGEIRRNADKKLLLVVDNMWKGDVTIAENNVDDVINGKRFLAPVFTYSLLDAGSVVSRVPAGTSIAIVKETALVSGGDSTYALSFGYDGDGDEVPESLSTLNVAWSPIFGSVEIVDNVTTPAGIGLDNTVSSLILTNKLFTADAATFALVTEEDAPGGVVYSRITSSGVATGGNMTVDGTPVLTNTILGGSYIEFDMDVSSPDILRAVISPDKYATLKTALDATSTSDGVFAALASSGLNFYAIYTYDYDNLGSLIASDGALAKKAFTLGWGVAQQTLSIRYRMLLVDSEKAGAALLKDPQGNYYFAVSDGVRNKKPNAKIVLANALVIDSLVQKATEEETRPVETTPAELGLPASFDQLTATYPQFKISGTSGLKFIVDPKELKSSSVFAHKSQDYTVKGWNIVPLNTVSSDDILSIPLFVRVTLTGAEIRTKFNNDNAYAVFANALDEMTGTAEEKSDKIMKLLYTNKDIVGLYKMYRGSAVDLISIVRGKISDGMFDNYGKFFTATWVNGVLTVDFNILAIDGTLSGMSGISAAKTPAGHGYFILSDGTRDGAIVDPIGLVTAAEAAKISNVVTPTPTAGPTATPSPTTAPVHNSGGGCNAGIGAFPAILLLFVPAFLIRR